MDQPSFADELHDRIGRHLAQFGAGTAASAVWSGYLAALLEHGHISGHDHDRLSALVPDYPEDEMRGLFVDADDDD